MKDKYIPNPDIKLVLNGGQEILDSATVPVEWHFSKELIAKKPQYIVVCDHEYDLDGLCKATNTCYGYRYDFAVKDLVGYIQMHKAGRHHFVAVVFCGDEDRAKKSVRNFLKKSSSSVYEVSISYNEVEERTFWNDTAVTAVEFEVPAELFAKKPETAFSRFVWSWANRWKDSEPVDQCEYRKRKIRAFTLQPPLFLIGRLIAGIFETLYTLIGAFLLLFIGYRPIPIWKNVWYAWSDPTGKFKGNLFMSEGYKRWRAWEIKDNWAETPTKNIPVWAVPAFAIFEIGAVIFLFWLISSISSMNLLSIFVAIGIVILIGLAILAISTYVSRRKSEEWERKLKEKAARAEKAECERETARENAYLAFLRMNAALDRVPNRVDVRSVMRKVGTVTRFQLGFWALKARACRPYAK